MSEDDRFNKKRATKRRKNQLQREREFSASTPFLFSPLCRSARTLRCGGDRPMSSPRITNVILIGKSDDTIAGLQSYLYGAGVPPQTSRSLRDTDQVAASTTAAVIFPDGFEADDVVRSVLSLRQRLPLLLLIVVTSTPQNFRSALAPDGHSRLPIVLPKPTFGWTILDAIRDQVRSEHLT